MEKPNQKWSTAYELKQLCICRYPNVLNFSLVGLLSKMHTRGNPLCKKDSHSVVVMFEKHDLKQDIISYKHFDRDKRSSKL